jgi:hypothetical protein
MMASMATLGLSLVVLLLGAVLSSDWVYGGSLR